MLFGKKKNTETFYSLFEQAANNLVIGAKCLEEIVNLENENRKVARKKLHEIEHSSDQITHRIHELLNATFVTPLDRDDISMIAGCLDDCMDYMDEAGDFILLYELGNLPKRLIKQVDILHQCSQTTADALHNLNKGKTPKEYAIEINDLENKGDTTYRKLLVELFKSDLDPVTIIKLKDIIESLEQGCDSFERLANVIETIFIKES